MSEEWEVLDPEPMVVDYLRDHPDFFTHYPELAENLRIPHPCRPAASTGNLRT